MYYEQKEEEPVIQEKKTNSNNSTTNIKNRRNIRSSKFQRTSNIKTKSPSI